MPNYKLLKKNHRIPTHVPNISVVLSSHIHLYTQTTTIIKSPCFTT